jgi:hypothetical protein
VGEEEDADSEEDANNYVYHVVPYRESLVSISKSKV